MLKRNQHQPEDLPDSHPPEWFGLALTRGILQKPAPLEGYPYAADGR